MTISNRNLNTSLTISVTFAAKFRKMNLKKHQKLREQLAENKVWPLRYMFKCIAPNEQGKVQQVSDMMPAGGEISYKNTKNLKYVSVTCIVMMPSVDSIIEKTNNLSLVPGVMVL